MKNYRKIALPALAIAVASALYSGLHTHRPVVILPAETLRVAGMTRSFRVVLPKHLPAGCPILLAFHGAGDSTETMAAYSRLDDLASKYNFLLVYPAVTDASWSIDAVQEGGYGRNPDVEFFDALLRHLTRRYSIDRQRVYVTGMSNGASFAQLLANVRSSEIAATVACSGPAPKNLETPVRKAPILLIVGSDDRAAGALRSDYRHYLSSGHLAELVVIEGLRHEWSIDHNDQLWKFLSSHSISDQ